MIRRLFVEKKEGFGVEAKELLQDLSENLGLRSLEAVRVLVRYDVEGLDAEEFERAKRRVFSEPQADIVYEEQITLEADESVFAVEYLPGQYDQRADSAEQCIQILTHKERPKIATARVYVLKGMLDEEDLDATKKYLINSVDSREASLLKAETLQQLVNTPDAVKSIDGFISKTANELVDVRDDFGLAMSQADIEFCQKYFKEEEGRDPTLTEIKLLDTYWSDHCRHTTFLTQLEEVDFEEDPATAPIKKTWEEYVSLRKEIHGEKKKDICLMDIALLGMRALRRDGKLDDLEESEEINAASIVVPVVIDGKEEEWLVMFKNETHNHPTEIEPFGGAATCLGGAIRDPLSGRAYVYQAMRVTGAADPRTSLADTVEGKLPQRKITLGAAHGYSSYGNQIGIATGQVAEIYHPRYVAKRMEVGAVIAAAPRENVYRGTPEPGDIIVLVGGRTGRDGVGGATGSSKEHTDEALDNSAEVQKGNPPMERKLQRLFRRPEAAKIIVRCNDFGAGGVSVAIGELAPSLEINLNEVSKKYDGLDGTELAISESQERMAVVLRPKDVEAFIQYADEENLEAKVVADVTDTGRLKMVWRDQEVVNVCRDFLDSNGATLSANAKVMAPEAKDSPFKQATQLTDVSKDAWFKNMADLNRCSQKGLIEHFDSTIGSGTILHPFGGVNKKTPPECMSAKISSIQGETDSSTLMSYGYNPDFAIWSPYHAAIYAIIESVARIVASGGELARTRLTLQEYFEKLRDDRERWGKPLAALLGALKAQLELGTAAIGGKDSMSGSFNDIDVPPTLVSFAVAPSTAENIISPEFKAAGNEVVLIELEKDENELPNFEQFRQSCALIEKLISEGKVLSAHTVRSGGIAEAISRMAFGNDIGFKFDKGQDATDLFAPNYGSFILELKAGTKSIAKSLGKTISEPLIQSNDVEIYIDELVRVWEKGLESVFHTKAEEPELAPNIESKVSPVLKTSSTSIAKPKVFIPIFPGTNCEWDTKIAFERAGAEVDTLVFRNRSEQDVEESLQEMAKRINEAQILMLPGGFSAGDEPDGSGKFIAATFRNPILKDATMNLLKNRDGLALGICNGFQALIKLGLVPYGEIRDLSENDPTLTYNNIGRHVSCYVRTKVSSTLSPWLANCSINEMHSIPVSHGEGKFVAPESVLKDLADKGQLAFQYCDKDGLPSSRIDDNPNGSLWAIEGITSPDGRVLGKMGHSERYGNNIGKNIDGKLHQPIFEAGVQYFK